MLSEEVKRYRELSGDNNTNTPISRIGGYLDGYERALEQEPILDKIREEIDEQYDRVHPYNISCAEGLEMALEIIDKYKAESLEQEPSEDVPDINAGNVYVCSCGYGWDKSKVVRHHFCPNCGAKVVEGSEKE